MLAFHMGTAASAPRPSGFGRGGHAGTGQTPAARLVRLFLCPSSFHTNTAVRTIRRGRVFSWALCLSGGTVYSGRH